MEGICGAHCDECELFKNENCKGCKNTNSCPFGKKCWIAKYILSGGKDNFDIFEKKLIDEFNSLNIIGMPIIDKLYPLHGEFVNLEYQLPNGNKIYFLDNSETYLGNQVECEFNDDEIKKCFGLVANMSFLLVCEYDEGGINPEIIIYKKR